MRILYTASEALPYAASGGLADVAGSLPAALCKAGHDCRVVLPLYKSIKPELRKKLKFLKIMNTTTQETDFTASMMTARDLYSSPVR